MKVDEFIEDIDVEEESIPDNTFYYSMDGTLKDTDYIYDPPEPASGELSAHYNRDHDIYWILTTSEDGDGYIVDCSVDGYPRLMDLQPVSVDDPLIVVQANNMSGLTPSNINTIIKNPRFLMQQSCVWSDEISARKNIELAWFSPEYMNDYR